MVAWKIGRRARGCRGCGRDFAPGAELYTLLDLGGEEWVRVDLCPECFDQRDCSRDMPFWKTRRPAPSTRAPQVDLEGLKVLLLQLARMDLDRRQRQLTYLIALILLRKKVFKLGGTLRDAGGGDRIVLQSRGEDLQIQVAAEPPTRAEMPVLRQALRDLFEDHAGEDHGEQSEGLLPEKLLRALWREESGDEVSPEDGEAGRDLADGGGELRGANGS